jgi:flagellar export protein FliJ
VKPQTRLDVVVKLREKDEERARLELAAAQRAAAAAATAAATARANAKQDHRSRGSAAHWDLTEIGHFRALRDAAVAEKTANAASEKLNATRQNWGTAYKRAESMRRVAETRRAEIIAERDNQERKEMDEIGAQLYVRSN